MNHFSLKLPFVKYRIRAAEKSEECSPVLSSHSERQGSGTPASPLTSAWSAFSFTCSLARSLSLHTLHSVWRWLETAKISVQINVHTKNTLLPTDPLNYSQYLPSLDFPIVFCFLGLFLFFLAVGADTGHKAAAWVNLQSVWCVCVCV